MKSGSLIGWSSSAQIVGSASVRHSTSPNAAALEDCKNPIQRETCNPAGGGFHWIVEIWPDPDTRSDIHPSLVTD